ncbi:MAG: phosphatase PAP2 family protein [Lachnospiraceae bacterium]|nr:phosphatase PAP2 family protein [Lachnospiraceae bacterium]
MTKEQYEKISAPFRRSKKGMTIIRCADKVLTVLIFAAYPVLIVYLLLQGLYARGIKCIAIPAISFVLVSAFRKVYSAKRPYEALDIVPLIKKDTVGKSFPSRHVFSVFIIGMTFFYINRPWGMVVGIVGILMGYVRVVGGVHFPKDVFAGAVIGILCGMCYF